MIPNTARLFSQMEDVHSDISAISVQMNGYGELPCTPYSDEFSEPAHNSPKPFLGEYARNLGGGVDAFDQSPAIKMQHIRESKVRDLSITSDSLTKLEKVGEGR